MKESLLTMISSVVFVRKEEANKNHGSPGHLGMDATVDDIVGI